jgi:hypothetical protein
VALIHNDMEKTIFFECEVSEVSVKHKGMDRQTRIVLLVPESDGKEAEKLAQFVNVKTIRVEIKE